MTTMEERRAAAMALDFGDTAEPDTMPELTQAPPTDEPQVQTEEPPAAPPPVEKEIPGLDDVLKARVVGRHSERVAKEQAEQDARDAAEFRRLQAEGKLGQAADITPAKITEIFRGLKPEERTAVLRSLVTETRSPDAAAVRTELTARLEQLEKKIVDPKEVVQKTKEELAAEAREQAFEAVASDSERFPHLARLPPQQRLAFAYEVLRLYDEYDEAHGVVTPLDDERIANEMERHLAARAQPTNAAPAASQKQADAGTHDPTGTASGTLNDLAASAPSVKPRNREERVAAAVQLLERWPKIES